MIAKTLPKPDLTWLPLFLIIYNFCANLSNDIYLPSLPTLVTAFDTTPSIVQFTMTVWFAGVSLPQLFLGPLSDQIGRRPILFFGAGCFLLATLLCIFSNHINLLILARFFQGVGVCSLNVTTYSILADLYSYKERVNITNRISMWGNLAPLVGPIIGGYLLISLGWQANFIVILLLGLVSVAGLWFVLPESNTEFHQSTLKLDYLYQTYASLIKNKSFIKFLLPYCFMLGGLIVYLTAAPFIIITQLKVSPAYFGLVQMPVFIAYILGSLYIGFLSDDVKIRQRLNDGIKIALFGSMLMVVSCLFETSLILFIVPIAIYSLGFSLCAGSMVTECMSAAGRAKGAAAAFLGFGMAVCCMLSSLAIGLVYNGTMISIASLLFLIMTLAAIVYRHPYFNEMPEEAALNKIF